MKTLGATGVFVLAVFGPSDADAELELIQEGELTQKLELRPRAGYYLSLGFLAGPGGSDDEDIGSLGAGLELAPRLRVGQVIHTHLALGLLAHGSILSRDGFSGGGGGLSLEVSGLWESFDFRGGVGLFGYAVGREEEAQGQEDDPGGALAARFHGALGYTLFLSQRRPSGAGWGLSGVVEGSVAPGDLLSWNVVFGLELTRWFGRDEGNRRGIRRTRLEEDG